MKKVTVYDEGRKIYSAFEKDNKKLKKKLEDFFNEKFD